MAIPILRSLAAIALVVVAAAVPRAEAQTARSSSGDGRALAQLQQLAQERTALQAEVAKLKGELEAATTKLKAAEAERTKLAGRVAGAEAAAAKARTSGASNDEALAQQKQRMDELVGRYRELANQMRGIEGERSRLAETVVVRDRDLSRCAAANVELFDITSQAIDRFEKLGFGDKLARAEPFTRVARTRAENLADEFRQRAKENRLPPKPAPPADAATTPGT